MENDGKTITVKYVAPSYEIRKVTYVAHESVDEISDAVVKKMNEFMTADKLGKWEEIQDNDRAGGGAWVCSACRCGYAFGEYYEVFKFNFCPNCGAKMKEINDGLV